MYAWSLGTELAEGPSSDNEYPRLQPIVGSFLKVQSLRTAALPTYRT